MRVEDAGAAEDAGEISTNASATVLGADETAQRQERENEQHQELLRESRVKQV